MCFSQISKNKFNTEYLLFEKKQKILNVVPENSYFLEIEPFISLSSQNKKKTLYHPI
jgi:hypothetical protein